MESVRQLFEQLEGVVADLKQLIDYTYMSSSLLIVSLMWLKKDCIINQYKINPWCFLKKQ